MRALGALVVAAAALAIVPATASALSCPPGEGALAELHASDAAFIGQGIERRGNHVTMSVVEAFKGVAAGQTVEVIYADGFPMLPPGTETQVSTLPVVVLASLMEGRLFTTVCRAPGVTPDALREAAAADGQGLRCEPPPRIVWAVPTLAGRLLSLRVVVADHRQRTTTLRVDWGHILGRRHNAVTTTRVPRSRMVLLRHRYRHTGDVQVRLTVTSPEMLPSSLCFAPLGSTRMLRVLSIPGRPG
jgi:hypothetical protein